MTVLWLRLTATTISTTTATTTHYTLLLLLCSRPTAPRSPAASQYIVLRPRQALILSKRFQTAFPKIKKRLWIKLKSFEI